MVGRNVVALTDGPRVVQAEGRTLTPEQARSLLRAASGERLEAAFVLMLSLGLRKGEVFGLRWADVDLDNAVITVAQALSRVDSRLVLGPVKTERSRRKINLPREVVSALRAHRTRQATERLALGESWRDTSLVFTNEIGAPIDPTNFRRTFDRVTAKAGLVGWHPHELRHSCASLLLAARCAARSRIPCPWSLVDPDNRRRLRSHSRTAAPAGGRRDERCTVD